LPRHERPHRLDVIGAALVMAASSSFMLALNLGGVRYPWLSVPVIALLACALALGAGFVARLRTAAEPLIPIAIFSDPAARLAIAAHSFGWGSIVGLVVFLPMYLQSALGWSPTSAGLSLVILMVTLNVSAGFSSQLLGRVRRYKLLPLCFLTVGVGAVLALALSASTMTSEKFEIILFLIGIGIGFGPTAPLTQVALQNTVSIHNLGAGLGTMNFAHAGRHDPHRCLRRHLAGKGAGWRAGGHIEPEFFGRCIAGDVRRRIPRHCRHARRRVSVAHPA
jgi:hypothetical protein